MAYCKESLSGTKQPKKIVPVSSCLLLTTLLVTFLLAMPSVLMAEDTVDLDDQWRFGVQLYGWLPNISGSTASGSNIDVSQGDLLDALQMTLQGIVGVTKRKWSFTVDTVYLKVGDNPEGFSSSSSGYVYASTDVDLKAWIVTLTVGYRVLDHEKGKLRIIAGARALSLDLDVDVDLATFPPVSRNLSASGTNWDGILGVNGEITLNEQWFLPFYLDIGTGDSDLTWQAALSVGYRFSSFDVIAGYRYLTWDLNGTPALDDLTVNGPYAGIRFSF